MIELGVRLSKGILPGSIIFLNGDLGAGKTTLIKGIIQGMGYSGPVTSPTYTLVESYDFFDTEIYHFDLYRLHNPEELEAIGIRDMLHAQSVALFEWPGRGVGVLPSADGVITIGFIHGGDGRAVEIMGDLFDRTVAEYGAEGSQTEDGRRTARDNMVHSNA